MSKAQEKKVIEIIANQMGRKIDEVKPEQRFVEDLGVDSLDSIEIIMSIEEEFDLEIPDADAAKMDLVSGLIKFVKEKTEKK